MQVVDWITRQANKIKDNFNDYKFYVKNTPEEKIDSSTVLSLTVFTDREENAIVPCTFKWFRLKNGIISEAQQFKGSSFICEPSDVGCTLQAIVESTDPQYPGTAILNYGPVGIDVLLKNSIQVAVSMGEAIFNVDLISTDAQRQCELRILDDYIKISHCNSNAYLKFNYSLGQPTFQLNSKDFTKMSIIFNEKYESEAVRFILELFENATISKQDRIKNQIRMNFRFLNKKSRDQFTFAMKAFNAKKQMKISSIINKIQKLELNQNNINYIYQIESLKSDLRRLYLINLKQKEQKKVYYQQSCKLEQEIQDIISSYTKIIETRFKNKQEFEESFADFQNKKDQAIAHKYQKIEEENIRLKDYIRNQLDGDLQRKSIDLNRFESKQSQKYIENPFLKKKQPFNMIGNSQNYEILLNNLSADQQMLLGGQQAYKQKNQKQILQQKLNKSLQKISRLEQQLQQKKSMSMMINGNDELNKSLNKSHASAIEVSTSKIIKQKINLEIRYNRLKQQNQMLKQKNSISNKEKHPIRLEDKKLVDINTKDILKNSASEDFIKKYLKQESINEKNNPQAHDAKSIEIQKLKDKIKQLQYQRDAYKINIDELYLRLKGESQQKQRLKTKYQKKINDLNEQIMILKKNGDVHNRSQHLSMEMEEYNLEQNDILKEQNAFLLSQTERLSKMCEKFKGEYKRLKEVTKLTTP